MYLYIKHIYEKKLKLKNMRWIFLNGVKSETSSCLFYVTVWG